MVGAFDKKWNEAVLESVRDNDDLCSVDPETGKITMLPMRASQEIRARALECACRLPPPLNAVPASIALETMFWETVRDFEAYIKGGKT